MSLEAAPLAYLAAATLLTLTPGLDTAMVLRTLAVEGPRRAWLAWLGIACGCLVWGVAVASGLGVLMAASHLAYQVLEWAGAAYLAWLGINLLLKSGARTAVPVANGRTTGNWFLRGFLTNLLNPKVGVFYVSFLPQFVPAHTPVAPFIVLLALIHDLIGFVWFAVLIYAGASLRRWIAREAVARWLDRVTGAVFLGFAAKLAFDRR